MKPVQKLKDLRKFLKAMEIVDGPLANQKQVAFKSIVLTIDQHLTQGIYIINSSYKRRIRSSLSSSRSKSPQKISFKIYDSTR